MLRFGFLAVTLFATILASAGFLMVWAAPASAAGAYSIADLKGDYGFTEQGEIGQGCPLVSAGRLTADGAGTVTGSAITNVCGGRVWSITYRGSYTMNPDGTGTLTLTYTNQPDENGDASVASLVYNIVIVDGKAAIRGASGVQNHFTTINIDRQ